MCGRATHRAALGNCVTQIARPRLPFSVGDRKAYRVLADNTDAKSVEQQPTEPISAKKSQPSTIFLKRGECSMGWLVIT